MRTESCAAVAFIVLAGCIAFAANTEEIMIIKNDLFSVSVNADKGSFSVQSLSSKKEFIPCGRLSGTNGTGRSIVVSDKTFGKGKAIEVRYAGGNVDKLMLLPDVPFVLLRSTLHNSGTNTIQHRNLRPFNATIDLNIAAVKLCALGTGGLSAPGKNQGSYAWLTIADPLTRNGVVAGWLTHDRGSGVVFSKLDKKLVRIDSQIDYGRLLIAPGKDADTETFAIGYFDDSRLGMEAWADAIAKIYSIKLKPQPVGYCTWYHAQASNEKELAASTRFAASKLAPFGFNLMQIDDGWQLGTGGGNGPKKVFTDHDPKGPYPRGMKAAADNIKAEGLTPGIWFMPFAGTHNDPFFKDHQDWFVKTADGKPYDTAWGGTCMDMTHPGAREYLHSIVKRIAHEWGYTYFKIDGMWTGSATKQIYVNSGYKDEGIGDAVFANPDKTNIEAYRDGIKLIRKAAGNGVFILGCCAPQNMRSFGGAFGLVDAMRVGPDNGPDWGGLQAGPLFTTRNYHLHGRIWYNDPDPVYVRTDTQLEHAKLICSWVTISGSLNLSSELMGALPADRLDILKRTMPSHGLLPRPVDLFENEPARIWLLTDERQTPRRDVIALYNWTSAPLDIELSTARAGLPESAEHVAFDFWAKTFIPPFKGILRTKLAKESCQILSIRPMLDRPFLLSTSRHITQGIVDVTNEKWTPSTKLLSGSSKVVAGDDYELRIVAPMKPRPWKAVTAKVSTKDKADGVQIKVVQERSEVRATILSPKSREVEWKLEFE